MHQWLVKVWDLLILLFIGDLLFFLTYMEIVNCNIKSKILLAFSSKVRLKLVHTEKISQFK